MRQPSRGSDYLHLMRFLSDIARLVSCGPRNILLTAPRVCKCICLSLRLSTTLSLCVRTCGTLSAAGFRLRDLFAWFLPLRTFTAVVFCDARLFVPAEFASSQFCSV